MPDILINNAGWTRAETISALDAGKIEQELDLNLTGVMTFADPLVKAMAGKGSGSIVFISSVNAMAHFGNPAYARPRPVSTPTRRRSPSNSAAAACAPMSSAPDPSAPPPGTTA